MRTLSLSLAAALPDRFPSLSTASNATILFGTDTFLTGYARAAHPYDFRSLRYVLAGAEPVKERRAAPIWKNSGCASWKATASPRPRRCSPSTRRCSTASARSGRLMPGMEARLEPVPGIDEGGRLLVRGPNVMLGYLKADNPGVLQPPPEGWHDTGDIVTIDAQGFVTIKGRAKRFAKIAGEMVSLAAVEPLAAELWPDALSAVASVPDARKGERSCW